MNYTDAQFNALIPFEDNFRTAVEGEWTRRVPADAQTLIRKTYEDASGTRIPYNSGCQTCLINLLKRAGRLYFADKKEREASKIAPATSVRAAQQPAPAQAPTQGAKPQVKKSSHHRNRSKSAKK